MSETKLSNSAQELATLYNVSRETWRTYLKPLREKGLIRQFAKIYTPKELEIIINHLGTP